jgi:DNA-binding NarL/FixJ family response regulator
MTAGCRSKNSREAELTVVNLIAQGVTNRDVAAQLHLSSIR